MCIPVAVRDLADRYITFLDSAPEGLFGLLRNFSGETLAVCCPLRLNLVSGEGFLELLLILGRQ